MDCIYSFEPPPGGTWNEFPVFVKYLFPRYVQNIDLESPNGDSSNAWYLFHPKFRVCLKRPFKLSQINWFLPVILDIGNHAHLETIDLML